MGANATPWKFRHELSAFDTICRLPKEFGNRPHEKSTTYNTLKCQKSLSMDPRSGQLTNSFGILRLECKGIKKLSAVGYPTGFSFMAAATTDAGLKKPQGQKTKRKPGLS
jgi:hypothetical protein